eukprot:15364450-Ditylum_brightwellii.AAC.2
MALPFQYGFTLRHWLRVIDVMLEKDPEKLDALSPVQFGNREGCTALDALLLKVVTMDLLHLF